jgi:hypothetical protein
MPDAFGAIDEKHRGCFQQPDGWSTRSCNEAVAPGPSSKPTPHFECALEDKNHCSL